MNVLVVSTSLNPESNSRILAKAALEALKAQKIEADWLDLREAKVPMCDGDAAYGEAVVAKMTKQVGAADAIIVGVPIYNYDVSASAKNLVELTGKAWEGKTVAFLCAAGGQGSYMSVMSFANSLMLDFRCVIVPRFVYATGKAFDNEKLSDQEVEDRIAELVVAAVKLASA
jgi:NAD(P)H-dependent FMN reductase